MFYLTCAASAAGGLDRKGGIGHNHRERTFDSGMGQETMRLTVEKEGRRIGEFEFTAGPVHIGRGPESHVLLPDRRVSRQHAVIFSTPEGQWMVEDLDSANKTYLNDAPVHKSKIETGDELRIADFTIHVNLEAGTEDKKVAQLEDTLITAPRKAELITRNLDAEHAPDIKFPAKRAKDFFEAIEEICKAGGLDHLIRTLLAVMFRQFNAARVWCALRNEPAGPMTAHTGRRLGGEAISLNDIQLKEKVTYAVEKGLFLLFPSTPADPENQATLSALIAPLINPDGCFGVFYLDNTPQKRRYSLADLDYLMLLAIHTAAILENF